MGSSAGQGSLTPPRFISPVFESASSPMAKTEGPRHEISDVNDALALLIGKSRAELLGRPFCELLPQSQDYGTQLDAVFATGDPVLPLLEGQAKAALAFCSLAIWPVNADGRTTGLSIEVTDNAQLQERTLAINEALLLGSLRQHELAAAAEDANVRLQAEIVQRMQSESDALMLTKEISHRIKNNLQMVVALIAREMKTAPPQFAERYAVTETHIMAIAKLYSLISQSDQEDKVQLGAYLGELAANLTASLLESGSAIKINVVAEDIDIEPERAVAFGLLVNELGTNAVKHAFPHGRGRLTLRLERMGGEVVLTVSDDGVGIVTDSTPERRGRHGSDYVAIFVRRLGGTMTISHVEGTTVSVRFPSIIGTD